MRFLNSALVVLAPFFQQLAVSEDLTALPLDALIGKLPHVGKEWQNSGENHALHPVSAEFSRRLQAGVSLTAEQWGQALLDTGALRTRQRWPAGVPFAVSVRNPGWLETNTLLILDFPPELGLRRACVGSFDMGWCGNAWASNYAELAHQELGVLSQGQRELRVRLELWRLDKGGWLGLHSWFADYLDRKEGSQRGVPRTMGGEPRLPDVVSTSDWTLPITTVSTSDEVVPAITSQELDAAVRRSLSVHIDPDARGGFLYVNPVEELEGTGLSLDVEVFQGNALREEAHLLLRDEDYFLSMPREAAIRLVSLAQDTLEDPALRSAWRLRIHGTDTDILLCWSVVRRWSGTLELPMEELLDRGRASGR